MHVDFRCLFIIAMSLLPIFILAQEWVARYNGPIDSSDVAHALALDNAGNVYVTGYSYGSGSGQDCATVKYDSLGVEQWVARYNGPNNGTDAATALAIDASGNVYITGYSDGGGATWEDYITIKYDDSGVEQWVARYHTYSSMQDRAHAITIDDSGNVYVTGTSGVDDYLNRPNYDYATVKYDSLGVEQWAATFGWGGWSHDIGRAIALDSTGNVYVTGRMYNGSVNYYDYATVKYSNAGVWQWVARYNGPGNYLDGATAIAIDDAGYIYVTGGSVGSGTDSDYATVKYDATGVEQWVARYNGPADSTDVAGALALDSGGYVYITGASFGLGTGDDYATVRYDSLGIEQWVVRHNGLGNGNDRASAIALDGVGNLYVTGYSTGVSTHDDYTTVRYDVLGVFWNFWHYNGPGNYLDQAVALSIDNVGDIYVTGTSYGSTTGSDYATMKYSSQGIGEDIVIRVNSDYFPATIIRGPLQLPEGKKCQVFDITGRVVDPDGIQPGIYFVEVEGAVTQKVVKVR